MHPTRMVASYVFSGSGSGKRPCLDPSHTRQRTSESTDILSISGTRSARNFDHVFAPEYRGVFAAEMELEPATSQGSDWAYVGSRVGRQAMRDQNLDVEDCGGAARLVRGHQVHHVIHRPPRPRCPRPHRSLQYWASPALLICSPLRLVRQRCRVR